MVAIVAVTSPRRPPSRLLANEALQLSGLQGRPSPALGCVSPRSHRSLTTRSLTLALGSNTPQSYATMLSPAVSCASAAPDRRGRVWPQLCDLRQRTRVLARVAGALGCAAALGLGGRPAGAQSRLRFTLPPGPYAVGFRATAVWDDTRTGGPGVLLAADTARGRPLQVSIWYPARPAGPESAARVRMRFRDYAALTSLPGQLPRPDSAGRAAAVTLFRSAFDGDDTLRVRRELDTPVNAVRDAPPAPGTFPVVVYGPSFGSVSFENSVLCEYLASAGYVVVASPSWGAAGPMTSDFEGLEAQARDMEYLVKVARTLPGADPARVAVVGYSWGGLSNVLVAMRNRAVRAIVGLDGSIAYWYFRAFAGGPGVAPDRLVVPALFLKRQDLPWTDARRKAYGPDTAFAFFDSLRYSDAYLVTLRTMRHQNFGALSDKLPVAPTTTDGFVADSATASVGYERVARYTRAFLDSYLRPTQPGRGPDRGLDPLLARPPEANGIPHGEVTVVRRTALRPLRTLDDFVRTVGAGALADAPAAFARIRARDPGYVLPEGDVDALASQLRDDGRRPEALGLLRLNVAMYPGSASAAYRLAEAYRQAGDRARAIEAYERVLTLAPSAAIVATRLKELRGR